MLISSKNILKDTPRIMFDLSSKYHGLARYHTKLVIYSPTGIFSPTVLRAQSMPYTVDPKP